MFRSLGYRQSQPLADCFYPFLSVIQEIYPLVFSWVFSIAGRLWGLSFLQSNRFVHIETVKTGPSQRNAKGSVCYGNGQKPQRSKPGTSFEKQQVLRTVVFSKADGSDPFK